MSKTWRNILILVCVVALLVGGLVTVLLLPPPDTTEDNPGTTDPTGTTTTTKPVDTTVTLVDISKKNETDPSLITSAKITTKTFGTFTVLQNDKGELIVDGQQGLPREAYQFDDLEETLTEIIAQKLISENGSAEEFGFDDPQASFDIRYTNGTTFAFEIGDEEPFGSGRYLRVKGETKIYLAEVDLLDSFALNPLAYIETGVVVSPEAEVVDENSSAEVDVVLRDMVLGGSFYGKDGLAFRLANEADSTEMQASHYVLTKPYVRNANGNVLSEDVMNAHSITAEIAVVARYTQADLKQYGLDTPYITATFHTASRKVIVQEEETTSSYKNVQEHTLSLSKPENGYYYMIVDDFKSIYRISASQLPWAELTYGECVLPTLFLKNITTVDQLRYTIDGKLYTFNLTHNAEEEDADLSLIVNMNGEKQNTLNFRKLYQVMMAVTRFGETDTVPSGTPDIVIEIIGNDDNHEKMELYYNSASTYIVKDKSGDTYTVKNSRVKNLLRQTENFLNGIAVQINE